MEEYIYFLEIKRIILINKTIKNNIKLGYSKYPHSRLRNYQTSFPCNIDYKVIYKVKHPIYNCYKKYYKFSNRYLINEGGLEWYNSKVNEELKI